MRCYGRFLYFVKGTCVRNGVILLSRREKMAAELYFYVVAVIRQFVYYFYVRVTVYVCRRTSTPVVFGFDVFICILLETESVKMILVVGGDVVVIEVDCKQKSGMRLFIGDRAQLSAMESAKLFSFSGKVSFLSLPSILFWWLYKWITFILEGKQC